MVQRGVMPGKSAAALIVLLSLAWPLSASAQTPYSFQDLVAEAGLIFTGEVMTVESRWVDSGKGRVIVTAVTFRIERLLKGQAGGETTLEFLGGRIGEVGLTVEGVPRFAVGDRDIVFRVDTERPQVS